MCVAPLLCVLLCAAAAAEPQDESHVTAAVPAAPVAPEAAQTTQTKAPNQIHQTISVDDIPKCHRNDSNLDDCLKDAIEKALTMLAAGNVQLGVPGLHPLKLDNIDIHNPKKQLHLIMRDVEIFGIANSTVHKIEPRMKNHQVTCWARSPLLVMTGKYKLLMNLGGQSVGGNGRFTMTFKNLGSRNHMTAVPNRYGHYDESVHPDDYVGVIFTGTLSDVSHVHLDFENLFYGGNRKGKEANDLLNEKWQEFWSMLQAPLSHAYDGFGKDVTKKIFTNVPVKFIL